MDLEEFGPSERFGSQPASSRSKFEDFQDSGRIFKEKSRIFKVLEGFPKDLRAAGIDFY